jgi:hypothetical protein
MYPEIRTKASGEIVMSFDAFCKLPTENIIKSLEEIKQDKRRKKAGK